MESKQGFHVAIRIYVLIWCTIDQLLDCLVPRGVSKLKLVNALQKKETQFILSPCLPTQPFLLPILSWTRGFLFGVLFLFLIGER